MKAHSLSFAVKPIGTVVSPVKEAHPPDYFKELTCLLEIEPEFEEALDGLETETFILVLFYFHKSKDYPMKVHPRGDLSRPLKGVFATCSPRRPNFIGVTRCRLLEKNGLSLKVKGLDAIDGTPVIDIKPYRL